MVDPERGVAAVLDWELSHMGDPAEAVRRYVGAEYIQHNPVVADGKQGFIDYFDKRVRDYPDKPIEFVRAVAEGDLAVLHTHQVWPGGDE